MPSDNFSVPPSFKEGQERYQAVQDEIRGIQKELIVDGQYDYGRMKSLNGKPATDVDVRDHVHARMKEMDDLGEWVHDQREQQIMAKKLKALEADTPRVNETPVWQPPQPSG